MKNVINSINKLCSTLTQNRKKYLLFAFLLLCTVEAFVTLGSIWHLPADPKNELFLGFSLQRIILLTAIFIYSLLMAFLTFASKRNPKIQTSLFSIISKNTTLTKSVIFMSLIFSSLALIIFNIPTTGIRGTYPFIFEKLDPVFVLIFLFGFQLSGYLLFFLFSTFQPFDRKPQIQQFTNKYILPLVVLIFPFLFFFPRTIPINGEFASIANDFIPTSYTYKVYLLDNLSHFHFPLWSPSEAGGFPFFSNPFAQVFYPLNIPMTVMYYLNGGYSILDHQRFSVLGIAIFALGLFFWLKEFSLSTRSVFIASLLIPVSFRMAELVRYPSGLHSAAWYPWILFSLTKMSSSKSIKKSIGYAFVFIFSCFSLVTGGYQYYLYYSLFLLIPYLFVLWIPRVNKLFFPNGFAINKSILKVQISAGFFTILISTPYLLQMVNLLSLTTARGGGDYTFSTIKDFSLIDTLGSLVYPPSSLPEGWYYFSFPCLILILLYLFSHRLIQKENRGSENKGITWNYWYLNPWVKIFIVFWFVTISFITYGSQSFLFNFLWQYLPYFSHLRFIERLNIVLIPVIALLLAISLDFMINVISETDINHRINKRNWWFLLFGTYFSLLAIQVYLILTKPDNDYWGKFFYMFSDQKFLFVVSGAVAFIFFCLTGFLFYKSKEMLKANLYLWIVIFVFISLGDLWHVGAYMWWNGTIKSNEDVRIIANIPNRVIKESFSYRRTDSFIPPSVILTPVYNVSFGYDWYFEKYKSFYESHQFEKIARTEFLGISKPTRVYFTQSITYDSISAFLDDSRNQTFSYEIIEFTGEVLKLKVNSPASGYVSYIDNWDSDWKVYINNEEVPLEKLFSTFKTVKVEKGESIIQFSYEPGLFPARNYLELIN